MRSHLHSSFLVCVHFGDHFWSALLIVHLSPTPFLFLSSCLYLSLSLLFLSLSLTPLLCALSCGLWQVQHTQPRVRRWERVCVWERTSLASTPSFFSTALLWEGFILEARVWRLRPLPMALLGVGSGASLGWGCPHQSPRLMGDPQREGCSRGFWPVVIDLSMWTVCLFPPFSSSNFFPVPHARKHP